MNTQVAWWYNNTWPYVFISATPVTVCWAVAAGFPFFTQPSIWTHISTNHSQGGPADHNPLLHLEGEKQKAHKWKVKLAEGGDFSFTDRHDKWYLYIKICTHSWSYQVTKSLITMLRQSCQWCLVIFLMSVSKKTESRLSGQLGSSFKGKMSNKSDEPGLNTELKCCLWQNSGFLLSPDVQLYWRCFFYRHMNKQNKCTV